MRAGLAARLRARLCARGDAAVPPRRAQEVPPSGVPDAAAAGCTEEEIREFLEGDLHPTRADPVFKERLRRELRALLARSRRGAGPPGS